MIEQVRFDDISNSKGRAQNLNRNLRQISSTRKKWKYLIGLLCLIVVSSVAVVQFQLPERISYALYGMSGYDMSNFITEWKTLDQACVFQFNADTIANLNQSVLFEEDGLIPKLKDIRYYGDSYIITIISKGKSTFNQGELLVLDYSKDFTLESEIGKLIFEKNGIDGLVNNSIQYIYNLYSPDDRVSYSEIAMLDIPIRIEGIQVRSYKRK